MLTLDERIKFRDELFIQLLFNNVIKLQQDAYVLYKSKLSKVLSNNNDLNNKYKIYINEFRFEEEAVYCLTHSDDFTNHICPVCGNLCEFSFGHPKQYRKTCGNMQCIEKRANSKEAKQKSEQTWLANLGVTHPSKSKKVIQKTKDTKLKRHGDSGYNNREKAKNTCQERYKKDNPFQVEEFKEKARLSNIARIGVPYLMQSEEQKEKWRKTYFHNHNLDKLIQNAEVVDIVNNFNKAYNSNINLADIYDSIDNFSRFIKYLYQSKGEMLRLREIGEIFGLTSNAISYRIKDLNLTDYVYIQDCLLELQFIDLLNEYNIEFIRNNRTLKNDKTNTSMEIDILMKKFNIGIEIDDLSSHNISIKDTDYHLTKTLKAKKDMNVRLIHLWEWELNDIYWPKTSQWILHILNQNKIQLNLSECTFKYISKDEETIFLNQYSITPYQTSDVCLGFYHNNELIQIIYFNPIESHLVMNICTKFGYNVINGTKDIINYYLRNSGYNYILVYCDMSKFTGKTFEDLGFKFLQYQEPSIISELSEESNTYKQLYNCGYNIYIINL